MTLTPGRSILLQALETIPVGTLGDGNLAGMRGGWREERHAPPLQGDRNTAHPDVKLSTRQVGQQRRPGGWNQLQFDAHTLGQVHGHIHVQTGIGAVCLVALRERPLIAGQPNPQ